MVSLCSHLCSLFIVILFFILYNILALFSLYLLAMSFPRSGAAVPVRAPADVGSAVSERQQVGCCCHPPRVLPAYNAISHTCPHGYSLPMRGSRVHRSGEAVSAPFTARTREEGPPWTSVSPVRARPPACEPSRTHASLSVDGCRVACVHPLCALPSPRVPPWMCVAPLAGENVPPWTLLSSGRRPHCLSAAKGSLPPPHPRAPRRTSSALSQ